MEKFFETGDKVMNLTYQLRRECLAYLKEVATLESSGQIEVCDPENDDYTINVTYNQGKQLDLCEYVKSMYVDRSTDTLFFNLETEQDVNADRISTWDLYNVCDFVYQQLNSVEEE